MFAPKYGIPCYPNRRTANQALALAAIVALLVLGAAIVAVMGGCAAFATPTALTPQDVALRQVTDAEAAYIVAATAIDVGIANGDIKGQTATELQAAQTVAWSYIMAARDAVKAGMTVDADTQLQLFKAALDQLVKATAKAKPPATQPG